MAPPSTHPSGELVRFESACNGHPANIDAEILKPAVAQAAAACALARNFPAPKGGRHACFLALAGAAARAGWTLQQAQLFHHALYRVLWGAEAISRKPARK